MSQQAELTTITQKRFKCRHVHATGRQCGSPALRNEQFCYFHHTTRSRKKSGGFRYLDATEPFELPLVEDRASALSAAAQIFCRIASNNLDLGRAGKLLYNLQILNALLPREKAAPESQPAPSPQPLVEDRVLLEELVLDEAHGLIAPITEMPEPAPNPADPADPLQNCHPERSSASAPNAVEEPVLSLSKEPAVASHTAATTPRISLRAPKRVYTEEEKEFLKCTTSSTHYAPVHRPRLESITDDDIIAAINALRRRCSLGPIDTDPNWNRATLSADNAVILPLSEQSESKGKNPRIQPEAPPLCADTSAFASRYPEASASGLSPAAQEEGALAPGVQAAPTDNEEHTTDNELLTLNAVAGPLPSRAKARREQHEVPRRERHEVPRRERHEVPRRERHEAGVPGERTCSRGWEVPQRRGIRPACCIRRRICSTDQSSASVPSTIIDARAADGVT